jgi:hypothetical protein
MAIISRLTDTIGDWSGCPFLGLVCHKAHLSGPGCPKAHSRTHPDGYIRHGPRYRYGCAPTPVPARPGPARNQRRSPTGPTGRSRAHPGSRRTGHVGHKPRLSGPVGHEPHLTGHSLGTVGPLPPYRALGAPWPAPRACHTASPRALLPVVPGCVLIIVVDRGSAVDWGGGNAPDQPPSPDQPVTGNAPRLAWRWQCPVTRFPCFLVAADAWLRPGLPAGAAPASRQCARRPSDAVTTCR